MKQSVKHVKGSEYFPYPLYMYFFNQYFSKTREHSKLHIRTKIKNNKLKKKIKVLKIIKSIK